MTSGTRGKRSHAAGESKPSRPTAGEQGEPEPNRGGREERKMALFEQGERERETGHRLTGFIVEPNDHACVRFFFLFLFDEALTRRERACKICDNRSSKRSTTRRWSSWADIEPRESYSVNGDLLFCVYFLCM